MKMFERFHSGQIFVTGFLTVLCCLALAPLPARANVYATNIRVNGSFTNQTVSPGTPVTITYTLNEPASRGVVINIASGSTVIRTLSIPAGNPGSQLGLNTVTWNGLNSSSNPPPLGLYTITISASSSGYTTWTQTTDDFSPATYLLDGRGLAVNQNTNSPYYGRIYIANSALGGNPGTTYGDNVGILALNADGSIADTNIDVSGGYAWSDNDVSPWKVKVAPDDSVYASETVNGGLVYRWDANLSTNSFLPVLRADNRPGSASLSGPFVVGSGTNAQIWMCDTNPGSPASLGVKRWLVSTNGACATNDTGTTVVGIGGSLTVAPFDVALDPAGNIYVCQFTTTTADPVPRVFRFPAYDPATNSGLPELAADWSIGAGNDTLGAATAIALDPTGTYVAVAFQGASPPGQITNGNTAIFYATNGALATNLDLGIPIGGIPIHQDTACAWDAVGNVYYIDWWSGRWRAVSPPGTNSATTIAPATVQIANPTPPHITGITYATGTVTINFTGATTDAAGSFTLQAAGRPTGTFTNAAGANITATAPGTFRATVPPNGPVLFYRLQR